MNDDTTTPTSTSGTLTQNSTVARATPATAGAILREARQAQGVHIAALAASMKVSQKKLEALEADRIDELPDATFARALAKTVCRTLKIDSAPVLALLPRQQFTGRLEHVSEGINEPFRDHGGRHESGEWNRARSPLLWLGILLLIGIVAVFMAPQGLMLRLLPASGGASAATTGGTSIDAPNGVANEAFPPVVGASEADAAKALAEPVEPKAAVPSAVAAAATFAASVADAAASTVSRVAAAASVEASALAGVGPVQVHARSETWVQVEDANAKILIGRSLAAGESVFLDGRAPLKVKIGNAAGTELVYRGRAVDLAASTRDNVARLELK